MTAPDDVSGNRPQRLRQPGRLGIVQVDDVPVGELRDQLLGAGGEGSLVDRPFRLAELAAVAVDAVEAVVDPLGDPKEAAVPTDRDPARVHPGSARVGEEGLQHLGHAAATGGRVDVPDHASREDPAGLAHRPLDPGEVVSEQSPETLR